MFALDTKILVVDDTMMMRSMIKKTLTGLGFTKVFDANDGATAWPLIDAAQTEGDPFGLVLSDWNMPIMTGIELLKKIRADERLKDVPFVIVTSEGEKTKVIEAISAGITQYVVKPFTANVLKDKLDQISKQVA